MTKSVRKCRLCAERAVRTVKSCIGGGVFHARIAVRLFLCAALSIIGVQTQADSPPNVDANHKENFELSPNSSSNHTRYQSGTVRTFFTKDDWRGNSAHIIKISVPGGWKATIEAKITNLVIGGNPYSVTYEMSCNGHAVTTYTGERRIPDQTVYQDCYAAVISRCRQDGENSCSYYVSYSIKVTYEPCPKVTFNANGGDRTMPAQSFEYNVSQRLNANEFVRDGYVFKGWTTSSNGSVVYSDSQSISIRSDLMLYAVWEKASVSVMFNVMFNANGGTVLESSHMVSGGSSIGALPTPTWAGHRFDGWYTAASGGTQITATTVPTADVTYYAHWTAISVHSYTVTFNANGGSGTMAAQAFTADVAQSLRANAFTRAGYTFAGWATSANGNVVYSDRQSIKASVAMVLYAQWTPEHKPVQHNEFKLYTNDEADLNLSETSAWDGWLEKDGVALGTIFVKLSKVDSSGYVKLAATVQKVGARKEKVEFRILPMNGAVDTVGAINGLVCKCKGNTLSGSYDGCEIKGTRNLFASKIAADKAVVAAVSAKWGKVVNVILEDKYSLSIGSKGKVNVTGFFADGAKDTTKAQMIVGADWCAIPVMFTKKHKIAFVVWLPMKQGEPDVQIDIGPDAIVGKPGNMTGEYCFAAYFRNPLMSHYISGAEVLEEYIPYEEKVTMSGNRLVVSKPGKLKWDTRNAEIVETGDGNFAALKISCKAAKGVFTGSFKIWSQADSGRLKATSVKFNGVMVEDFGVGWAKPKNTEVLDVYLYRPEDD